MPEIDILEVEKQAEKKKEDQRTIIARVIDGKTYFYSKFLNKSFTDYGEANQAETSARLKEDYKRQGKNEFGQTKEDIEKASRIKKLLDERSALMDQVKSIDLAIQKVKRGELPKAEAPKKEEKKK